MLSPQAQVIIGLFLAGVVLITLGYRIRWRREWRLITGFRLGTVRDPEGLGRWVGGTGIVLGTVSLAAGAHAWLRPDLNPAMGAAYAVMVCLITVVLAVGAIRYVV